MIFKKRILLLAVTLFMCGIYIYVSQSFATETLSQQLDGEKEEEEFYCYVMAKEDIEETKIISRERKDFNYLFLPSGMDLSALQLCFFRPKGEQVSFQGNLVEDTVLVDVKSQGKYNEKGDFYQLQFDVCRKDGYNEEYPLRIMSSANIPSLYLVSDDPGTKGRSWVEEKTDHSNMAAGLVYELDKSGNLICKQKAEKIRIRGNYTKAAKKKPYQIKLSAKEDLLENGEPRKSWALLANAYDTTLLHNTVSYQLGKELGLFDSPDCTPVDVYYDGDYRGNYLLTELPDISYSSINIDKNGSYMMQIDYTHYMEQEHYMELSNGMFVTVEEPEKCTEEEAEYLRQLWENLISAIDNGGINPATGKTVEDYLDIDSYARYYLVQQFTKNADGFTSSTYCYIPSGEDKIYFGGLWDFDLSFGTDHQVKGLNEPEGYYPDNKGSDFSTVPVISQRIKDIYEEEFRGIVEDIFLGEEEKQGTYLKSLAAYIKEIYASQKMNYTIWDYNSTGLTIVFESYEDGVAYLRDFVEKRHAWLYDTVENSWTGCGEILKTELVTKQPVAGTPLEPDVELSDKWSGQKIMFVNFTETDTYFLPDKEYHYRIVLSSQLGASFGEDLSISSNYGKVESFSKLETGMMEIILNVGVPKVVNTVYNGVDYAPVYDKEYYLQHYPEVADLVGTSDEAVLTYFVTEGMSQQHQACEDFDVRVYIARYNMFEGWENPDVYMHYITDGIFRGWSGKLEQ